VNGNGNIALTGSFLGSIGFPPSAAMSNSGAEDAFVAELDSNGNGLWSKQIGNSSLADSPSVLSVAMDGTGDVLVTGQVMDATDLGIWLPGVSGSGYDVLVAKYSGTGTLLWAKRTLGVSSDIGQAIAVKPNGDAVVAGYFYSSADFGCGPLSNPVYMDAAFLVELGQ
jgi:hypothetical protein